MKRRGLLLGAAALLPLPASAQNRTMPVIGYLGGETLAHAASRLDSFRAGLRLAGYEEGRNVAIEYRWAEGHNERLPALAEELVRRQVALIAAPGSLASALAAKAATSTIPIVFETGADPVASGLIASLNRPGGNVTGVVSLNAQVAPKRLELMHEVLPNARLFALMGNSTNPTNLALTVEATQAAAGVLGVKLHLLNVGSEADFERAFATMKELKIGGLIVANDTLFGVRGAMLGALALRHGMPAVHQAREFAVAGGLIGYGGSVQQSHSAAGVYCGRILKGEKPVDLPVQQVTALEMTVNLKTARAFGLTLSPTLLARANEVIE